MQGLIPLFLFFCSLFSLIVSLFFPELAPYHLRTEMEPIGGHQQRRGGNGQPLFHLLQESRTCPTTTSKFKTTDFLYIADSSYRFLLIDDGMVSLDFEETKA
jgi:hypothetical protein